MPASYDVYTPRTWNRAGLVEAGYMGFKPFSELLRAADVTRGPGVYAVLRSPTETPVFLPRSPAGKLLDHTVAVGELEANWINGAEVIYIGQARCGRKQDGLWRRIRQYRRTGEGRADNHSGGTWIWQLGDSAGLLVCWITPEDRSDKFIDGLERHLVADFRRVHGRRPFANRQL